MNYLLILGVVAIWALIVNKIIGASDDKSLGDSQVISTRPMIIGQEKWYMKSYTLDSSSLTAPIKDPFILQVEEIEETIKITPLLHSSITPLTKAPVIWPTILFAGFLVKTNKNRKYAILSINGQSVMLSDGESAFGVKVNKNWGDSLTVSYEKQLKKIYLNTK